MADDLKSIQKRQARHHRYYEGHRSLILEKAKATYDPEKRCAFYKENREAILEWGRLRYRARKADMVREKLMGMRDGGSETTRKVIDEMLRDNLHASLSLKDIETLRLTLQYCPAAITPVDKCDEAVFSLRQ
jgi:hypothetical protein